MELQPGERLIMTGAGGGVGLHAIQLGVRLGADVMAVDLGQAKLDAATRWEQRWPSIRRNQPIHDAAREWSDGWGSTGCSNSLDRRRCRGRWPPWRKVAGW